MQAARAADRARRANAREQIRQAKEEARFQQRSYVESRAAGVDELNRAIAESINTLAHLLSDAVSRQNGVNWTSLRQRRPDDQPAVEFTPPPKPGIFGRFSISWQERHEKAVTDAQMAFQLEEARRISALHEKQAQVDQHNADIEAFRQAYRAGEPEAVTNFFELVFAQSEYPESFPEGVRIAFQPASRQLVVDFDLPSIEAAVPTVERYRYTKSSDAVSETLKTQKSRQAVYASVVAQLALRRICEIFKADREQIVDVASVNAFVDAIDRSTGQQVRPCLVSVRCTRADFEKLDLRHVEPISCLRRLNAMVSRSPAELVPVKPIVDFDMADPRFIQEGNVLSMLDSRPNLMELTPGEFENLITNLFQKMGLEAKLTQASRDGGVDCVAFDPRPVLGGKVVVQAKRYKNTVGVSAVRDLFGTMLNEGASKGILVTTSGYGSAAFEFAKGKPIELLSGAELLYMLKEHASMEAKIVMPELWTDPIADAP